MTTYEIMFLRYEIDRINRKPGTELISSREVNDILQTLTDASEEHGGSIGLGEMKEVLKGGTR